MYVWIAENIEDQGVISRNIVRLIPKTCHPKYGMGKMQNVRILKKNRGNKMKTLIKTLDIQNASLTVITAGRRFPLAQFAGKIEITEHQSMTPVLGRRCKGEKKIYASFILCQNIEYQSDDTFNTGKVYEAVGDVQGEQSCERLIFSGLRFEDMDPLEGTVTLEVTDLELIRKMIEM